MFTVRAFGHISELPPIAKTLVLSNTMFENYDFEGLKELEFKQDKDTDEFQMVNLFRFRSIEN